ncbi:heme ABC transporter permease [Phreatobacter aquaticus]|uniref:Heme ABC transporter permease n=1 Tax=Phreatobacter aquaticus TaxID=2570229 RepID=A0A4D7QIL1_9HYPH|nr:heme ABC transporter permease [Phreatobacter aquaticus]QCK86875.1 heme ABC transporter permease [Phreatobacter aquaticus]
MTATLVIALRAFSDGPLARATDRALVPLLSLGVVSSIAAFAVGLMVWPLEATFSSPLGRNHVLAAAWTVAYWTLLLVTRWLQGAAIWVGMTRWVMLGLAGVGGLLLAITGSIGGHLMGTPTAASQALRLMGWEIYTTYYVPDATLALIVASAIGLVALGVWGRRPRIA